jgi:hypothetical protein
MNRTHALLIVTLALVAVPLRAADRTEVIRPEFIPAGDLERFLTQPDAADQLGLRGKSRDLLPKGITGWAVDVTRNTFSVSGSDEDIEQLKRIIRLIDIPPRRVKVTARLLQLSEAEAAVVRNHPDALKSDQIITLPLLKEADRTAYQAKRALVQASLTVSNNRPAHLRFPATGGADAGVMSVTPRVNGDGTVTVITSGLYAGDKSGVAISLHRSPSGMARLVLDEHNRAWVLASEILPDAVEPAK